MATDYYKRLRQEEKKFNKQIQPGKVRDYKPTKDGIAMVNACIQASREGRPTPGSVKNALREKHKKNAAYSQKLKKLDLKAGGFF